jgi:hypothetical protein
MTDKEKATRKPRAAAKTFQQTMEEALDREEAKLAALTPKVQDAERVARSLRDQHTKLSGEINRACKLVGRKDLSERERGVPVFG